MRVLPDPTEQKGLGSEIRHFFRDRIYQNLSFRHATGSAQLQFGSTIFGIIDQTTLIDSI